MRIIDKQQDYYDYLQNTSDKLVFDRRGSYLLTKEMICERLNSNHVYTRSDYRFLLFQCGAYYWLLLAKITEYKDGSDPADYELELLAGWKNYDKPRELLKLDLISFHTQFWMWKGFASGELAYDKVKSNVEVLQKAIDNKSYSHEYTICQYVKGVECKNDLNRETRTAPLLKACGIGSLIDPVAMFCAVEEYFSMEKTASETTEAKGATNDDKIIMHGFDTKTSFRGKNQRDPE